MRGKAGGMQCLSFWSRIHVHTTLKTKRVALVSLIITTEGDRHTEMKGGEGKQTDLPVLLDTLPYGHSTSLANGDQLYSSEEQAVHRNLHIK